MENKKYVALTFDDGPSNVTESFLDVLEKENVVGTFFLIGQQIVPEKKATIEREVALGCEIANHSFTHSNMATLSAEVIRDEIAKTTALIEEYAGTTPKFFRPPYISVNDTMYDNIDLPFIYGIDSRDWDPETTTEDRVKRVLDNVQDGTLVLMHDMKDNEKTLAALPIIISELREQGYEFVTASRIFELKGVDPKVYHKLWSHTFDE